MTSCAATVVASLITAYQRFISPHKGFVCAFRVHHGGQSCSAHAKVAFQQHGLVVGWRQMRRRFVLCAQAAEEIRQSKSGKDASGRKADYCAEGACLGCSLFSWLS
ncbi:membrane protein insertion efficiency factor YidD [Thauera humireducens]|uniref:Membrane protein insertion efficiency factor YidD n=1 Tax=Thauera propionica TaxID=2019431 RepID=A0A235EVH0_9RHOO|nr:membrane protein insertion efficiency factor YidD [Thauera propionica]